MIRQDLHMHTCFCDGRQTPEEMVRAAIDQGFAQIGFSAHSHTFFDESYCLSREATQRYIREIARLKEAYRDKIRILCGIEQDYYSRASTDAYDYVIGSVHYLRIGENYIPVDESAAILKQAADNCFGGDMIALCVRYFETVADVVHQTGADIIGHFDLITKFNEGGALFDEADARYISAWQRSADRLLQSGALFEINTGAIARGYRKTAYPAEAIRAYLSARGAKWILSSDAHDAQSIGYRFAAYESFVQNPDSIFIPRKSK